MVKNVHTNLFPKERFFWSSFSSKKLEILSKFQDPRWRHVDFVIRYLNFPILSFHPVSTSFSFLVRVKEFKINFIILSCSIGTTSGAKSLVTLALWAWATLGSIPFCWRKRMRWIKKRNISKFRLFIIVNRQFFRDIDSIWGFPKWLLVVKKFVSRGLFFIYFPSFQTVLQDNNDYGLQWDPNTVI